MTVALSEASDAVYGAKAATLSRLRSAGFPVPDGFVVPPRSVPSADAAQTGEAETSVAETSAHERELIGRELSRLGDPKAAVRSSASDEDAADTSAAGMYDSVIGVRGISAVCEAVDVCRESAETARVGHYRSQSGASAPEMSVLVQRLVESEISGVMFTPAAVGGGTRIEASWGLGQSVVGGALTPDAFEIDAHGVISVSIGTKDLRFDSDGEHHGARPSPVSAPLQFSRTLNDDTVRELAALGTAVADFLGRPQDIEWAIADDTIWILQSRPITAELPTRHRLPAAHGSHGVRGTDADTADDGRGVGGGHGTDELAGTPASTGIVTARARIVSGPADFSAVETGALIVCHHTDPAWTPLFSIASGIITEVGGALSHAAIVAREYGIPAVSGVPRATIRIGDGDIITVDGGAGTITRV